MSNYYNLDGVKTELRKRIEAANAKLEAWQAVTFPTKKDRTPFASMSKNIDGAKYNRPAHSLRSGEYELTVYCHSNMNGYISDYIYCYANVEDLKDDTMKAKTQNYGVKESFWKQVYTYDLDDIKAAVNKRIEYLIAYIEDLNKQLNAADDVYNNFKEAYTAAMKTIEAVEKQFLHPDLYYIVRETIKDRYPYC